MNVRKLIDYSGMFAALDALITAGLPQMKLYREISKLVSARPEKGAAVEYLSKVYLAIKGFSPRNLRRMWEFYQAYKDAPEMLAQQIGLLPSFACAVPNFSIEEFTSSRYCSWMAWDPWEWRMELARRGVVAYGNLFGKKAGLVSRERYPDLANYQRSRYDFDARYEAGLASSEIPIIALVPAPPKTAL